MCASVFGAEQDCADCYALTYSNHPSLQNSHSMLLAYIACYK